MAQPREKGGRVVFIGNIPYGVSEEQICEIFGRCGQVVNFRLVYDKETGRPKGFGFLEYTNVDEAASAVRNLNEFEIMGRTLRVDYSNDNSGGQKTQNPNQAQQQDFSAPSGMTNMAAGQLSGASELPPLPQGTDVPPGLTAPDAISKTLSQLPPPQLLDMISQMKTLVMSEPQKATALLSSMPQLSYAIFQALLLLGLVDTSVLGTLIQTTTAPQQAPPQPQPPQQIQQPPPMLYQQNPPPQTYHQQPYGQPPPPYVAPQYPSYNQPGPYNPTPPAQPAYQPPPPQQQQQQQQPAAQNQAEVIQQLMAMTREQIFALDEATRSVVLQLRAQYGAPVS